MQRFNKSIQFVGGDDNNNNDDTNETINAALYDIVREHADDPIDALRDPNILDAVIADQLFDPETFYRIARIYATIIQNRTKVAVQEDITSMIEHHFNEDTSLEQLEKWLLDPHNVRPYALKYQQGYRRFIFYEELSRAQTLLDAEMQYDEAMTQWDTLVDAWLRGDISMEDAERYRQAIVGEYREQFLLETADDLSWERWVIYHMREIDPDDDIVDKYVLTHPAFYAPKTKEEAEYMVQSYTKALEKVGTDYRKLMPTLLRYMWEKY